MNVPKTYIVLAVLAAMVLYVFYPTSLQGKIGLRLRTVDEINHVFVSYPPSIERQSADTRSVTDPKTITALVKPLARRFCHRNLFAVNRSGSKGPARLTLLIAYKDGTVANIAIASRRDLIINGQPTKLYGSGLDETYLTSIMVLE